MTEGAEAPWAASSPRTLTQVPNGDEAVGQTTATLVIGGLAAAKVDRRQHPHVDVGQALLVGEVRRDNISALYNTLCRASRKCQ